MRSHVLVGLVFVLLATSRCACDDDLSELTPRIQLTPEIIDMGRRVVGVTSEAGFLVGNDGTAAVAVSSYTIEPMPDDVAASLGVELFDKSGAAFSVVGGPEDVGARRSAEGTIAFLPTQQARYGGMLIVRSNDLERSVLRVPVLGEGGPPLIEADPERVDFGVVNEGPGASRIVRLVNTGYDVLHISDLYIEGAAGAAPDAVAFVLNPEQSTTAEIAPGASLSVEVRMNPSEAAVALAGEGRLEGTLVVISDAENEPELEVPLVGDANLAPRAIAVELLTRRSQVKVGLGREVIIDGSDTEDPEGDPFTFTWTLVEKPEGSSAVLLGNTVSGSCTDDDDCAVAVGYRCVQGGTCKQVAWTRVTPDAVGTFVVRLRATDARGAWREADARILPRDLAIVLEWTTAPGATCFEPDSQECQECSAPPGVCDQGTVSQRLRCCQQLYCCGQNDLDLHLVRPEGALGDYGTCPAECTVTTTPDGGPPTTENRCYEATDTYVDTCRQQGSDCSFANRFPEWFTPGRDDDPRLDVDDIRGFGPEVITLNEPQAGVYEAVVHYFTDRIGEPAVATVKVYVEGELVHTAGPQLMTSTGPVCENGQTWIAASLIRSGEPGDGSWTFVSVPNLFADAAGTAAVCAP